MHERAATPLDKRLVPPDNTGSGTRSDLQLCRPKLPFVLVPRAVAYGSSLPIDQRLFPRRFSSSVPEQDLIQQRTLDGRQSY